MKIAVSLYDMTGNMVRPLAAKGWECYCFDIQNNDKVETVGKGTITFMSVDLTNSAWHDVIMDINPNILFAFPPCTDLAVSGAAYFAKKLAANPNYRDEAMNLVYIARNLGDLIGCPYMIENPVSVISSVWRKPDFMFHPYEYGGYLPEDDEHPDYPDLIVGRDAYTKKTCLWAGNGFTMPEKKPVEVDPSKAHIMRLGGKSLRTKNIRSATPRGFALAVSEHYG